jgi:hypothetical protein
VSTNSSGRVAQRLAEVDLDSGRKSSSVRSLASRCPACAHK